MTIKELIGKMIKEGKTDAQIAVALAEHKEDGKSVSTDTVVSAILAARKAAEIEERLQAKSEAQKAAEDAEAKEAAISAKLDAAVEAKLASINISPSMFQPQKSLKRFNHRTGEIEEVSGLSDAYKGMNDMFAALSRKDEASARSISDSIVKDNDHYLGRKDTPTVSDVNARGQFAIPITVEMSIMQLTQAQSLVLPYVNKDNVVYNSKIYPVMYGIDIDYIADQSTAAGEKNPTFTNPTIAMKRLGGFSAISNTIIRQKGADLVSAFVGAYSSALAKKLDQQITVGNVTGDSDLVDGIVFDALTSLPSSIALANLTVADLRSILELLSADSSLASTIFMANRKVVGKIGLFENTAGNYVFPRFVDGGKYAPFGVPMVEIPQIPSTLDVGGDARTGGTDDVLICADMSKVMVGLGETRIDSSEHFRFTDDTMVMRVIKEFGCKVLSGSSTAGVVAVAQELTN